MIGTRPSPTTCLVHLTNFLSLGSVLAHLVGSRFFRLIRPRTSIERATPCIIALVPMCINYIVVTHIFIPSARTKSALQHLNWPEAVKALPSVRSADRAIDKFQNKLYAR